MKGIITYPETYNSSSSAYKTFEINNELWIYGGFNTECCYSSFFSPLKDNGQMVSATTAHGDIFTLQRIIKDKYPYLLPIRYFEDCINIDATINTSWRYYSGSNTGYDIFVNKYDKLGRTCPDYQLPVIDTTTGTQTFQITDIAYTILKDSISLTKVSIKDSVINKVYPKCAGIATEVQTVSNEDISNTKSITISPNPVSSLLTITGLDATKIYYVSVTDIEGRENVSFKIASLLRYSTNISALNTGVYFIRITREKGESKEFKFMKQ